MMKERSAHFYNCSSCKRSFAPLVHTEVDMFIFKKKNVLQVKSSPSNSVTMSSSQPYFWKVR